MLVSNIKLDFTFENLKFRYKEIYGTIHLENLKYSLTKSLLW